MRNVKAEFQSIYHTNKIIQYNSMLASKAEIN